MEDRSPSFGKALVGPIHMYIREAIKVEKEKKGKGRGRSAALPKRERCTSASAIYLYIKMRDERTLRRRMREIAHSFIRFGFSRLPRVRPCIQISFSSPRSNYRAISTAFYYGSFSFNLVKRERSFFILRIFERSSLPF